MLRFIRMDNSKLEATECVEEATSPEVSTVEQNSTPNRWTNIDWDTLIRLRNESYADCLGFCPDSCVVCMNGTKYMSSQEVFNLARNLSVVNYEYDPYVEMYYYNKVMEKEQSQNMKTLKEVQFMSYSQKRDIAVQQKQSKLFSLLYATHSNSLGILEKRSLRSQEHRLAIESFERDDEATAKSVHLRVLAAIEVLSPMLP